MLQSVDVLIAIGLCIGLIRGISTGLVRQALGIAGTVVAVFLAVEIMPVASRLIGAYVSFSEPLTSGAGFLVVFVTVQVVVYLVVRLAEAVVRVLRLSPVNRAFGAVLGACKVALIFSIFFFALDLFDVPKKEDRRSSVLYDPVASVFPKAWEYASERLPNVRRLSERFGQELGNVLSDHVD